MHNAKTIVSVTPIRIRTDSRSFKIASSIARFGYTSIVIEAEKSDLDRSKLPFELRSMAGTLPEFEAREETKIKGSPTAGLSAAFRRVYNALLDSIPVFPIIPFLFRYLQRNIAQPLRSVPKASLYYVHGVTFFPIMNYLSKKHHAPLIYDAHDFYAGMRSPADFAKLNFGRRWITAFYRRLESQFVRKAAAVVTVSDGVAELEEKTFGRRPIVVRNCHDVRLDQERSAHLRQVLGLSSDQFILVAVGNAKEGAAIQEALDAIQETPGHVHLVFLGRFFEPHMKSIRSRRLEGRVHIVPPVKPFEVVPFIRSANASVILYYPRSVDYRNSLPNRFFQPLAAELPILYPELPEIKKIAEKYEIGIPIDPQIPRSISDAVMKLVNDRSLVARYKRNLRVARDEVGWEREEMILCGLISKALAQVNAR
jgi:glycosyltransferase involved in cell wall biosynthesis